MTNSPLRLLTVVFPVRDEEACVELAINSLHRALAAAGITHEIIAVDDGSQDRSWEVLCQLRERMTELIAVQNPGRAGFGRAVVHGLDLMKGEAVVIMMADESDDCNDILRYWELLNDGYDCVFGSRFIRGGKVVGYPWLKLAINRCANLFIKALFRVPLNDTTNAFKAYRREVIEGCRPLISPHFNLTVELPLKAIVRGYTYKVIPTTWQNRRSGQSKLKIKEMGSRYLFICLYLWLEKYFSRGDYRRSMSPPEPEVTPKNIPPKS